MTRFWNRLNKKEKRLVWITMVILGYALFDLSINFQKYKTSLSSEAVPEAVAVQDSLSGNVDSPLHVPFGENEKERVWRLDPFFRKVAAPNTLIPQRAEGTPVQYRPVQRVTLQAISIVPERKMALINGQVVQEGETIGKWRIIRIKPEGIVLRDDRGAIKILTMPQ